MSSNADFSRLYRRLLRRETHSSRAAVTVVVASLLIIAAIYLCVEIILHVAGRDPLALIMPEVIKTVLNPSEVKQVWLGVFAAVTVLLGLFLVFVALRSGRRGKHGRVSDRTLLIIDDRVLASSEAANLARVAGLPSQQVRVAVDKHSVTGYLTPFSGVELTKQEPRNALRSELDQLSLHPKLTGKVKISRQGAI
ncbi:hypothetical protein [Leucobacter sp. OH1287]|uniref:hypothetical protein n=1 Tax=Leucobacter sp. OH1287 TaxID=2491049 RepID=UPI000F5F5AFE|nr:hypothetical protein [Leucobacter sp. OH1287]RRD60474.1 hypothetical protein EII30_05735 [Leucobacter sp. OH1287]